MKRLIPSSLLVCLVVWTVFSWPLASHVGTAVPSGLSLARTEAPAPQMESGDHLQLLYHFWLLDDMLRGHTPWFHNLYEFNTGDDAARREPGSYYVPFSLFYIAGQALGGPALGWNLSAFLALWLTYLGTILLARRFAADPWAAAVCALLAITFPYRWINITAGSPTGFGMMWVPWLLLGLDIAVRDGKARGGLLAGLAVLFASWGDTHVFYFCGLLIPCWCLLILAGRESRPGRDLRGWLRLAAALAPVALGALLSVLSAKLMTKGIASTHLAAGRTWPEVALFSPHLQGLWAWGELGVSGHIYVGYVLSALLLLGALIALRRGPTRQRLMLALLLAGTVGIIVLALGPYGPLNGRCFAIVRKVIPQYVMIRQPAKIFCLLPSLLAVATALMVTLAPRRALRWSVLGLLLAAALEFHLRFIPSLSTLGSDQRAYAAAAAESPARPAAIVLPLWPGNSHFTSVYQRYASLYRIRMVNGYRPFVPTAYITNVFRRFESANQGLLDDRQLDELLAMKVPVLLLHEDMFPEQVSPFAVTRTLQGLLNNQRLTLLAQQDAVWAFRIEAHAQARLPVATNWTTLCPARYYDAKHLVNSGDQLTTPPFVALAAPDQRWLIRARGDGEVVAQTVVDDGPNPPQVLGVQGTNWHWLTLPQPPFSGLQSNQLVLTRRGGAEVDYALFAAGPWTSPAVGASLVLPAPCFFHAGHTDLRADAVAFHANRDRQGLVFYGPKLPLDPGRYSVRVDVTSSATPGTLLGQWLITCPEGRELRKVDVRAGRPVQADFVLDSNLPLLMVFKFHGTGDLSLRTVTITRDA